jgi:hypothetical protein
VLVRRQLRTAIVVGALVAVGVALPVLANNALEKAVLGQSMRSARATDTVSIAGESSSNDRIHEAAITTVGLNGDGDGASLLLGVLMVGAVAYAVVRRDERALLVAVALIAVRAATGLGFVPGFLVAAPVGAAGVALGWRRGPPTRIVMVLALAALPLVWAFQFTGGAGPQWGGRYVLLSSFLLTVAGVAALAGEGERLRRSVLAVAVAVTAFGLVWMHERTASIADASRDLAARREPVLISRVAHLVREGGGVLDLDRWLTAVTPSDLTKAALVAESAGADRIGVVDLAGDAEPKQIGSYAYTGDARRVRLLPGVDLVVRVYQKG